jgi:hypothetical protein
MTSAYKINTTEVIDTEGNISASVIKFSDGTTQPSYSLPVVNEEFRILNSFSDTNTSFGSSVDISGNYIAVGAPTAASIGSVFIYNVITGNLVRRINNPTPTTNNQFGRNVKISGELVMVADLSTTLSNTGSVKVFHIFTGKQVANLVNPLPRAVDLFGNFIDIYGRYAVIGVLSDVNNSSSAYYASGGAVHVYDLNRVGLRTRTILCPEPSPFSRFGQSVSLSGTYLSVAAGGANLDRGAVYIFDLSSFASIKTINNPNNIGNTAFGENTVMNGDYLLVGERRASTTYSFNGRAWIFDRTKNAHLFRLDLPYIEAGSFASFGEVVAIGGNYAAIGLRTYDGIATNQGTVYIYNLTTGQLLTNLNIVVGPGNNAFFGRSVAISGNYLAVGAVTWAGVISLKDITKADIVHQIGLL